MFFRHHTHLSLLERLERRRRRTFWVSLFVIGSILFSIFGLIYIVRLYSIYASDLLSKDRLLRRQFHGLVLYDRNNTVMYESDGAHEIGTIPFRSIPLTVRNATLAAEDAQFYQHPGFSWQGIARSVLLNFQSSNPYAYGGSTITQQLVKNALLDDQSKSYIRKIRELILSVGVDRRYSKDEILEMYLNSTYYGQGAYGIGQAAEIYFHKNVDQLTLSESAYLAGLPRAPSMYGSQPNLAQNRQKYVLRQMVENNFITGDMYASALEEPVTLADRTLVEGKYPFFFLYVRQQVIEMFGEESLASRGYRVYTTFDPQLQDFAQQSVTSQVAALAQNRATNGSAVILDSQTSAIRAMVGSADWNNDAISGKINIALSLQQPGSSFKPFVYLRALERDLITPATVLSDRPTNFGGGYAPKNYDGRFRGDVLPRRALATSLNVPAVEVMQKVGVTDAVLFGRTLGLNSLLDPPSYGLSLVLGAADVTPLEMTNAYATIANGGIYNEAYFIDRIVDKYGETIYQHKDTNKRVANEGAAYIISSFLSDANARQEVFGTRLNLPSGRPAAVKTGTTDDYRDAWTIGFTPSYTVGVWVGNSDNRAMDSVAGSLGAAPIWISIMEALHKNTPIVQFFRPSGVVEGTYCSRYKTESVRDGTVTTTFSFASAREVFISQTARARCSDF